MNKLLCKIFGHQYEILNFNSFVNSNEVAHFIHCKCNRCNKEYIKQKIGKR